MRRRLPTWIVALTVVGLVAPTAAVAAWSTPQTIAGAIAEGHQLALDADGNAVFTWREGQTSVHARVRSADGTLIQPKQVAPYPVEAHQLAVRPEGNALIVWRAQVGPHKRIQFRRLSSTGVLGPITTISPPGQDASGPQVAVNRHGKAAFTWRRYDGARYRIQGRTRSPSGTLGPVKTLSPAGQNAFTPQVALGAQGPAVFVWSRFVPIRSGCCTRIEGRPINSDGTLGAIQFFSPTPTPADDADQPRVGVDANGNAMVAWRLTYDDPLKPGVGPQTRRRSVAGTLGPVRNLRGGNWVEGLQLMVNAHGYAAYAWTTGTFSCTCDDWFVAIRSPAGNFTGLDLYPTENDQANSPAVDLSSNGTAVVAWERWTDYYETYAGITTQVVYPNGALGPLQTVSATGSIPRIAVNAAGTAVVAWRDLDSNSQPIVRAAAGP